MVARAQQAAMPVIGFLGAGSLETYVLYLAAFRKGLNEAGFVEGQNVAVEYRWAEGQYERMAELAADLVRRRVTVIAVPVSSSGARAAKAATSTIPIVFSVGEDPVKLGLVASIGRPKGNATGINFFTGELVAKRLFMSWCPGPRVWACSSIRPTLPGLRSCGAKCKRLLATSACNSKSSILAPAAKWRRASPRLCVTEPTHSLSARTPFLAADASSLPTWRCAMRFLPHLQRVNMSMPAG
jgi:hypothetical protein